MTYPDSVQFLYSLGNEVKTAKLGLERIRTLAAALGNPQDSYRVVHVAGTNGKGSTCAMIESALRESGLRTGLFTSPHLIQPTERIKIAGVDVTPEQFSRAFEQVHRKAEDLMRDGVIDCHPTYFETVTAMGLLLFGEARVDCAVVEVGLGGRLDATNIVAPALTVITPIDFDHEAYLGRSLEAIAGEKAGILKPGVPAVFSRQRPEAEATLTSRAADLGISVARTSDWQVNHLQLTATGSEFEASIYHIRCPLAGEHQVENALTAALALHQFGVAPAAIQEGIANAKWPCRLDMVSRNPDILIDGAHNPAGTRALADHLARFYSGRKITLIYGAMRDKAIEENSGILFPLAHEVILTGLRQARAIRPEAMLEMIDHPRARTAASLADALDQAAGADLVVIAGSLFLAGEARALLVK